ncbi:orotidine-5'-phosphate decarboxylase [Companilactobacillus sp.]|jgi:orotidine-5'-phosphate decarboxylase|uniref:orotidine-5'-phosphate decarboxylase n=1 Tax=Companilactobacillus sp. TaxID=2767905 RepID=UPI0025C12331|nr:orotidine-5'-phosphate decarboxylase [Companilactobacillus sp.]MCH4008374.1 orotidine-5'-phosphate decarboxylase [Companilactobacillus sp.]MCH4051447.1 orotidine-5'-phosphate decarboxylase [Companilactobacillus sp.]MCH4076317.1 orotidine-5'-phosphate decarboxylase [Companilactobacillus sp.]MCH4124892.1 orotidine-5'-phosphate decarboxylase [Companilactobacillus sp.]MCH4131434.1 orotidine-5'-phosphate decarboxylase [Companilactobacillus sp.]
MDKPVIVALDFADDFECIQFLSQFPKDTDLFLKIGLEMFCQFGYPFVRSLRNRGYKIFLDLKLHDIPNTVRRTCEMIAKWDVQMLTVHASGGSEMIAAAKEGLSSSNTKLLAVTQLTSLGQTELKDELQIPLKSQDYVTHLASLAFNNGADGVISSALEVPMIKEATSPDFLCVTPGIRPKSAQIGDQKRVATPAQARELGSDAIVVGRPITQASDGFFAYKDIYQEWK